MSGAIDREKLSKLADSIINSDNQVKIATLSDELTISQVVKFFEKQGRSFTKTMIQNYIRVGVLPPPVEKRYYTKDHLVLLTLIDNLKAIYSLDQIKTIFQPIRNDPQIFEDDMLKIIDVYNNYLTMRKIFLDRWKDALPGVYDDIGKLLDTGEVREQDKEMVTSFMVTLTIMAETIAMKELVNGILSEYIQRSKELS